MKRDVPVKIHLVGVIHGGGHLGEGAGSKRSGDPKFPLRLDSNWGTGGLGGAADVLKTCSTMFLVQVPSISDLRW